MHSLEIVMYRMGKVPIRLKEVVYTLSPFEQNVMSGLWKDVSSKIMHQVKEVSHLEHGLPAP